MQLSVALLATAIAAVNAHYSVTFPDWRGDSYKTQWNYPCGGVEQTAETNRTLWPLDGGAVAFKPGHPWAQTQINLGLGENVNSFPIVLVAPFNQTGNGTFCFDKLEIPEEIRANITEGVKASIQVIQIASNGAGLFNCADIEFSARAVAPSEQVCFNSTVNGEEVVGFAPLIYGEVPQAQCDANTDGGDKKDDEKKPDEPESAGSALKASTFGVVLASAALVAGLMM